MCCVWVGGGGGGALTSAPTGGSLYKRYRFAHVNDSFEKKIVGEMKFQGKLNYHVNNLFFKYKL